MEREVGKRNLGLRAILISTLLVLVLPGFGSINGGDRSEVVLGQEDSLWGAFEQAVPLVEALGSPIEVGNLPISVVVGDFNKDSHLDVASAGQFISVLLGDGVGGGNVVSTPHLAIGRGPKGITAEDFNGDGYLDLATANLNSDDVTILLGDGAGGFISSINFSTGKAPMSIATADFNEDGYPDLAIANLGSDDLTILLGDGRGSFSPAPTSPLSAGKAPSAVVGGDFNKDGHSDLAVATVVGKWDVISIFVGDGRGGFAHFSDIQVGNGPSDIAMGDFNEDGKLDLAVTSYMDNEITIAFGDGTGRFIDTVKLAGEYKPMSITTGDFNGDGHLDLAISHPLSFISLRLGNGRGNFSKPINYSSPSAPAIAIGDLNEDGVSDVVLADATLNSIIVLASVRIDGFIGPINFVVPSPVSLALGDFNEDGYSDLIVGSVSYVSFLIGNGRGVFAKAGDFLTEAATSSYAPPNLISSVIVGDFRKDGHLDFIAVNSGHNSISVFLGDGRGTFSGRSIFKTGETPISAVSGDFNEDGYLDLAVANYAGGDVSILLGNGKGEFSDPVNFPAGTKLRSVVTGDFNEDSHLDLVVANEDSGTVSLLLGDGGGKFTGAGAFPIGEMPTCLTIGDFNEDGHLDLAATNGGSSSISIVLGNGRGEFTNPVSFIAEVGLIPVSIAAGDLNKDGHSDLVITNMVGKETEKLGNSVLIFLGDGTGAFIASRGFRTGAGSLSAIIGDVDVNALPDIVVANPYAFDSPISILLNPGEVVSAG